MFKLQIFCTNMTFVLRLTINIRKSHLHLQCTLQLVWKDRVFFFFPFLLHSSLCPRQHRKCELSIRLVYPPFFCKLRSSSDPTNKNLREMGLEIQRVCLQRLKILHVFIYICIYIRNYRYYHLAKYWPFVLNRPVWIAWSATAQKKTSRNVMVPCTL